MIKKTFFVCYIWRLHGEHWSAPSKYDPLRSEAKTLLNNYTLTSSEASLKGQCHEIYDPFFKEIIYKSPIWFSVFAKIYTKNGVDFTMCLVIFLITKSSKIRNKHTMFKAIRCYYSHIIIIYMFFSLQDWSS